MIKPSSLVVAVLVDMPIRAPTRWQCAARLHGRGARSRALGRTVGGGTVERRGLRRELALLQLDPAVGFRAAVGGSGVLHRVRNMR